MQLNAENDTSINFLVASSYRAHLVGSVNMLKRLNGLKVSAKALFKSRDTESSNYEGTGSSHKGEGQATPPQKPDVGKITPLFYT